MTTRHSKSRLTTDCCSDMYGLLDWACSESFLVAIVLVLGTLLVWKLLNRKTLDGDAERIEQASRQLNLSLKASQRSQRHGDDKESLDDVRWSVSVGEINVKLSVDHTLEHTHERDVTRGDRCERTVGEVTVEESSTTTLSSTPSLDIPLKTSMDDARGTDTRTATSSLDNEMKQLSDGEQRTVPFQHGADLMDTLPTSSCSGHDNVQWNSETITTGLSGDGHDLLEAVKQCPVEYCTASNGIQSPAEHNDALPTLDVIKAAICEAGEFDSIPVGVESSAPIDQNPAGSVSGEVNADENINENTDEKDDGEWVVV